MINCILVNGMYDICVMHAIYILTKILLLLYFKNYKNCIWIPKLSKFI